MADSEKLKDAAARAREAAAKQKDEIERGARTAEDSTAERGAEVRERMAKARQQGDTKGT